ncbi:CUGBP Elav-like family member 2 isoform X4 [Tachypleus tridentatus]|uniref:CUGBP Elav-like family member 2 isoform X4 n=1 Tax=Tachypleus tridentatus TaxID=6853 RepID=UPI003FD49B7D
MTYRPLEVKPPSRRLNKRFKAKATASPKGAFSHHFLQNVFANSLFKKTSGLSFLAHLPLPLQCLALLMNRPFQKKPVNSESKNERKLFIGMLPKKLNENDVRLMFSPFGFIKECTILRDANGQSKGCGFVTYKSRQCAINAIKGMNHFQTMEGCSNPLVVKFADTQKVRDLKRKQQMMANLWNTNSFGNISSMTPQYLTLLQASQTGNFVQQPAGGECYGNVSGNMSSANSSFSAMNPVSNMAMGVNTNSLSNMENLTGMNSLGNTAGIATNGPNMDPFAQAYSGMQQYSAAMPGSFSQVGLHQNQNPAGKQVEGPEGANLFIYHLPQEFTDNDLAQIFLPFGNVISVKVFIDKQTNLSKCFGFVSYDSPVSAQTAIQAMNGYQIGTKRLKVQLKRSKESNKP